MYLACTNTSIYVTVSGQSLQFPTAIGEPP